MVVLRWPAITMPLLATGGWDGVVRVYDADTLAELGHVSLPSTKVWRVAVNRRTSLIAGRTLTAEHGGGQADVPRKFTWMRSYITRD